jgi:hypothetical protein
MKSLFLIIFLLIPSISIAGPLLGCDNDDVVRELRWLQIAIIESQRPPTYVPAPIQQEQPKPVTKQNKELTINDMKIKLYLYGGCK